jgi:hypothetical protein
LAVQFGSSAPGANAPSGVATFELIQKAHGRKAKPRTKVLGTAMLRGGRASLSLKPQRVLNQTITVVYAGDADYRPATVTLPPLTSQTLKARVRAT